MDAPQRLIVTVVKLFVLSVVVGWVVSILDLSIEGFLNHITGAILTVIDWIRWILGWTLPYAAIGALVVVPLWLLWLLPRLFRRRGHRAKTPPR